MRSAKQIWKIENTVGGDDTRAWSVPNYKGVSTYYLCANRGKESIALDLKADDDRAIFHRLLAAADVLIENYRPGVMEKMGLGWESLHARTPFASSESFL